MASKVSSVVINVQARLDKFASVFERAEKISRQAAAGIKNSFNDATASIRQVDTEHKAALGKVAGYWKTAEKAIIASTAAIALAVGGIGMSSLNTYGGYEQSMSNVAGILNIERSSEAYNKLNIAALEAGKTTTKTAQESADALSYMALAGWSTNDSIKGLMPVLRASEATGADLATTSDLITDSMSALGLQTDELQHYLDICARAQNKSNTTLTQMQEAYIGVGGTFKTFNTPLQESGALLGILANRGIKGAEAGNRLQSTLVNLTKKSGESAKAMAAIGVSAYDSQGNFRGITNVLRDVQVATAGLSEEERNNYLTMIAGKTQLTTLNALMSGLSSTVADGRYEFDALYEELQNSDGALNAMAETMTDNFSGAAARAKSAVEDLQIHTGEKIAEIATPLINEFAQALPSFTEKITDFLDGIDITAVTNKIRSGLQQLSSFIGNTAGFIVNHLTGFTAALKSFFELFIAYKIVSTMMGAAKAIKTIGLALQALPAAHPLLLTVAAVSAFTIALKNYLSSLKAAEREFERDSLAEHFGNINLSLEKTEELAKRLISDKTLDKLAPSKASLEEANNYFNNLQGYVNDINETHWKFNVGIEITAQEKENYLTAIENLVNDSISHVKKAWNADTIALNVVFNGETEGNAIGAQMLNSLNEFYNNNVSELEGLSQQLKEAVNSAWEDGIIDIDEQREINNVIERMTNIANSVAQADFEASLDTSLVNFNMSDLSLDSYNQLTGNIDTLVDNNIGEYTDTINRLKSLSRQQYNAGVITAEELNSQLEAYNKQYQDYANNIKAKASQVKTDAMYDVIADVYGAKDPSEILNIANKQLGYAFKNYDEYFGDKFDPKNLVTYFTTFGEGINESADQINNLIEFMDTEGYGPILEENFQSLLSQAEDYVNVGEAVPENIAKGLMSAAGIAAITGNEEAIKLLAGAKMSSGDPAYEVWMRTAQSAGENADRALAVGLQLGKSGVEEQAQGVIDSTEKVMNQDININPKVNIRLTLGKITGNAEVSQAAANFMQSKLGSKVVFGAAIPGFSAQTVPQEAYGTTNAPDVFIAGEYGPELIIGQKGSTVFPTGETDRIVDAVSGYYGFIDKNSSYFADDTDRSFYSDVRYVTANSRYRGQGGSDNITFSPQFVFNANGSESDDKMLEKMKEFFARSADDLYEMFDNWKRESEERQMRLANV